VSIGSLDLNLLLVLDAVLAERSVARAARRLHVTPSAISNALARLRAALGDPLVSRSGRGIVPTPRALELAPILARTLRELDRAVHGGAFDPATTTQQFTVAVADVGQIVRMPRLAALLRAEMPASRLRVVAIDSLLAWGGLASTEVDALIGRAHQGPGIHAQRLHDEAMALVVRRGHPTVRARLTTHVLAGLRHVDVQLAPGVRNRDLVAAYARAGIDRDVAVIVPTFAAAAAMVAATDLVATLPTTLVDLLAPPLGLRAVASPIPIAATPINLVWHERTHRDPAMRAFRDLVVRASGAPPRARRGRS
jgi:DNA-binding transcriptional LysR family regulator